MDNAVEIYTDPRMVMRVKNSKKEPNQITIELHCTLMAV